MNLASRLPARRRAMPELEARTTVTLAGVRRVKRNAPAAAFRSMDVAPMRTVRATRLASMGFAVAVAPTARPRPAAAGKVFAKARSAAFVVPKAYHCAATPA